MDSASAGCAQIAHSNVGPQTWYECLEGPDMSVEVL
jgi:hypothetical protein